MLLHCPAKEGFSEPVGVFPGKHVIKFFYKFIAGEKLDGKSVQEIAGQFTGVKRLPLVTLLDKSYCAVRV